jgi:hypothetical protein
MYSISSYIENLREANWVTAEVFFTVDGQEISSTQIVNLETRERYCHKKMIRISLEAGALALGGILLFTVANAVLQVVRLATLLISIFCRFLIDLFTKFSTKSLKNTISNFTYGIFTAIIQAIWSLAKSVFCPIGLEYCAIRATVSPIKWRPCYANIERFWRGTDRKYDLRNGNHWERLEDFFTNPDSNYGFFSGYCFQPLGTLDEKKICKNADGSDKYIILKPDSIPSDVNS